KGPVPGGSTGISTRRTVKACASASDHARPAAPAAAVPSRRRENHPRARWADGTGVVIACRGQSSSLSLSPLFPLPPPLSPPLSLPPPLPPPSPPPLSFPPPLSPPP